MTVNYPFTFIRTRKGKATSRVSALVTFPCRHVAERNGEAKKRYAEINRPGYESERKVSSDASLTFRSIDTRVRRRARSRVRVCVWIR